MENLDKVGILELFTRLDDRTLSKFCQSSSKYRDFCNQSSILWKNRLLKYLGKYYAKIDPSKNVIDIVEYYKKLSNLNWRDYYISTMSLLDDYLISLHIDISDREDILKLWEIIEKEPFYLYAENLYENVVINEKIYDNLDETDRRWISPGVMLFHILIGNIKNEENIRKILNSDRLVFDDIDVVLNALYKNYDYSLIGIKYILKYYKEMKKRLQNEEKKDKLEIKEVKRVIKKLKMLRKKILNKFL